MTKVSLATTTLQSCMGCHISLLDLDEEILDLLAVADIKCTPIADVKRPPKVDVALIEGAVANEGNEEVLKDYREKADILVAFGTCACFGGIPGMRNLHHRREVLDRAYVETESTVDGRLPDGADIPRLLQNVKPLSDVVKVDYIIPGCPPVPSMIKDVLVALVEGREPELPTNARENTHRCSSPSVASWPKRFARFAKSRRSIPKSASLNRESSVWDRPLEKDVTPAARKVTCLAAGAWGRPPRPWNKGRR